MHCFGSRRQPKDTPYSEEHHLIPSEDTMKYDSNPGFIDAGNHHSMGLLVQDHLVGSKVQTLPLLGDIRNWDNKQTYRNRDKPLFKCIV